MRVPAAAAVLAGVALTVGVLVLGPAAGPTPPSKTGVTMVTSTDAEEPRETGEDDYDVEREEPVLEGPPPSGTDEHPSDLQGNEHSRSTPMRIPGASASPGRMRAEVWYGEDPAPGG